MLTSEEGVNQAYAWLNFLAGSIRQGDWPLWDPYTFSGHVFSGEMQTGAFYPLYFPLALFPLTENGLLHPALYHVLWGVSHFLCAWFMLRLVRELGLGDFAGILAGVCFSFGGLMGHIPDWPHMLNSGIWLPLIFLLLLKALNAGGTARAVWYACACGLCLGLSILAGGLHLAIMQGIVIVTAAAYRRQWRRGTLVAATACLVGFAAGAIQLLPSIEYSRLALRFVGVGMPPGHRIPYKYLTDNLYAHVIPGLLIGAPRNGFGQGETLGFYVGVFPVLLAGIGIWKNWRHPWVKYLTGLGIAAIAYSFGATSLLHGVLYVLAPFLWLAREADRFMYLADFSLALLAAYGAATLFSATSSAASDYWTPLSRLLKWVAAAAAIALVIPALYGQPELTVYGSLSLVLILVAWLLFRHIVAGHTGTAVRVLVLSVVLFDLYAFDWSAVNRIDAAARGTDQMARLLSCSGAVRFIKSHTGLFRAAVEAEPLLNAGDAYQLQTTGGTGVTVVWEYQRFSENKDLLGVRYTLKPASATDTGAVYHDAKWAVYENSQAYPRAWLVHETLVETALPDMLKQWNAPGTDFRRTALLSAPLGTKLDSPSGTTEEQATLTNYQANRMDLAVHANGTALLVLSEVYYPGWKATVNERAAQIVRVDGTLRGIVVPPGDSRVTLRYRPASIYTGAALTVAAFALVLAAPFCLWFLRRRRITRA